MAQEELYQRCTFTPNSSVDGPIPGPRNDNSLRRGVKTSSQYAISGGSLPAQNSLSAHFAMLRDDHKAHVGNQQ